MLVDIGLKFYAVPSWPTMGDLEVKVMDGNFVLKFGSTFYKYICLEHGDVSS